MSMLIFFLKSSTRGFLFILLVVGSFTLRAQQQPQPLKIYTENSTSKVILYADNQELYAVSLLLELQLNNMVFSKNTSEALVIPGASQKFVLGELSTVNNRLASNFSYKYKWVVGDVNAKHDDSYEYDLPYQKGKSYLVNQGYNGSFSHQGENALDFTMPVGTPILAAREGKVVKVVQDNTQSCPREECKQFNNYIIVLHADGSYASYAHIKHMGANVKTGDLIKKSALIGYSGNVGWSGGPHLHFVCFTGGFGKHGSVQTKFRTAEGKGTILKQGNSYLRDY
jgi:murein DD-endopeptidase MepM/ murein hydrolase activator NlpD